MQKMLKFNSNKIIGLVKRQLYRITVLDNGRLFLKQRTTLPDPYQIYVEANHEPISDDFLEKSIYVIGHNKWSPKISGIVFELLGTAIENSHFNQVSKIIETAKKTGSEANQEELEKLKLYVEAIKVINHESDVVKSIDNIVNSWIKEYFEAKKLDQETHNLFLGQNEVNNADIIKYATKVFNSDKTDKIMQLGILNILLTKRDLHDFDDNEKQYVETFIAQTMFGLNLSKIISLIKRFKLYGNVLSYNMCLKIEKNIGILADEIKWSKCVQLFNILNKFHELRPKFLQLIRNKLVENVSNIKPEDALTIIEFLHYNRIYDLNLLKSLLEMHNNSKREQMTISQRIALQHIELLLDGSFDTNIVTSKCFTSDNSERSLSLLASFIKSRNDYDRNVADNLIKLIASNFTINNGHVFGRALVEWIDALFKLEVGQRGNFTELNTALVKAVNSSKVIDNSQKEWALDTLALVVD